MKPSYVVVVVWNNFPTSFKERPSSSAWRHADAMWTNEDMNVIKQKANQREKREKQKFPRIQIDETAKGETVNKKKQNRLCFRSCLEIPTNNTSRRRRRKLFGFRLWKLCFHTIFLYINRSQPLFLFSFFDFLSQEK